MRAARSPSTYRLTRPGSSIAVAAVAALALSATAEGADPESIIHLAQQSAPARDLVVLMAVVNGVPSGSVLVIPVLDGRMLIDASALERWRVRIPSGDRYEAEGRRFVAVDSILGASAMINSKTQQLVLTLPATAFEAEVVDFSRGTGLRPSMPPWAGFANYSLFGYTSKESTYGSGLFELGVSGPYGSGTATFAANTSKIGGGTTDQVVHLDATWRYDDPQSLRTITAGDAITRAGAWGRSIRFGGVQFGTNFSLQPNLITYPLQAFPGTAVVPSTVDVFVNGSRVGSQQVAPGPFSISNVPLVTGSGDVQLVVRDAFGQQQIITQPFYASRRLLVPGLDDYTVSLGAERQNYGIESFDYGSGFGSAYWRRGLTPELTVELRGEGDSRVRDGGVTADWNPGGLGVVTAGLAGSSGNQGSGYLTLAGYEYQSPRFNFGVRTFWASPDFRMIGDEFTRPVQRSSFASAGYNFGAPGTVGLAWASQSYRGEQGIQTAALTYSFNVSRWAYLTLSASRTWSTADQTGIFAALVVPLGNATTGSVDFSSTRSGNQTTTYAGATLQRSVPIGEGWGYRLRATTNEQYEAGGIYSGPYGRYALDLASYAGDSAARANIAGGVGFVDGAAFAARPIVDSFGVVRVGDVENVRVYQDGNFAGRTDAEGKVILTRLYPYLPNRVTINEKDVPIDVVLPSREQRVAPYYRSAAIIDFGARRALNASLEIRLTDGTPLPAGTELRIDGTDRVFPVASGGEVFIPDMPMQARFVAEWSIGRCAFEVKLDRLPEDKLPILGPFLCERIAP